MTRGESEAGPVTIRVPVPGGPHNPCVEYIYHAFVRSDGTMTDLGTLGGNESAGRAISLSGEVVG